MTRPERQIALPGQESVWDYPRPPRVEPSHEVIEIVLGGVLIAHTDAAVRVLETGNPPTYYLPRDCFREGALIPVHGPTWCHWKGAGEAFDLLGGGRVARRSAWSYPAPLEGYEELAGRIAVMPGRMDRCTVDGETVQAQEGGYRGGWITSRVVGPFVGEPDVPELV